MFSKKLLFISAFLFCFANIIQAQNDGDDSTGTHHNHWKDFKWEMGIFGKDMQKSPTISFNYGFSKIRLKDFNSGFEDPNLIELKLGYTTQKTLYTLPNLIRQNYNYFFIGNISTDLSGASAQSAGVKNSLWRLGLGFSSGYGYRMGEKGGIIPYYTYSLDWSRYHSTDSVQNPIDKKRIDLYNDSFRFGTSFEGGLRIRISSLITVEAGYQKSIIFQRHLFWKWAGSSIIEFASQGLVDEFISEIMDTSPAAVPFINFLLKNGLAYGIYTLRYEKMNWPFSSEPPLTFRQYKVGITLVF